MTTDSANPGSVAEKQLIALNDTPSLPNVWTAANSSQPVTLTGGLNYYFEAVQAYTDGNDGPAAHIEVAWTGPGITQEVIPGANLFPFDPTVSEQQAPPPAGTIYPEANGWTRGGGSINKNFGIEDVLNVAAKIRRPIPRKREGK